MKNIKNIIHNDFKNFIDFRILHFMIILSLLLAVSMGVFPRLDTMTFVYVSVFIIPVIVFSISMYLENSENKMLPCITEECKTVNIIIAKIFSALVLNLIPMVLYIFVMKLALNMQFSIILFILVYIVSVVIHIIIGISLAIISKSSVIMSMSYIAYIVLFSVIPIFYTNNLIPSAYQYVMIISPAYLSGVLFDNIMYGYIYSPVWLIVLSSVLPFVYIVLLANFVVRPYFSSYLLTISTKA